MTTQRSSPRSLSANWKERERDEEGGFHFLGVGQPSIFVGGGMHTFFGGGGERPTTDDRRMGKNQLAKAKAKEKTQVHKFISQTNEMLRLPQLAFFFSIGRTLLFFLVRACASSPCCTTYPLFFPLPLFLPYTHRRIASSPFPQNHAQRSSGGMYFRPRYAHSSSSRVNRPSGAPGFRTRLPTPSSWYSACCVR